MDTNIKLKRIYSYKELEVLLVQELNTLKNIKKFCRINKLSQSQYVKLIEIRNDKNKKNYTDLVLKVLEIFNYEFDEGHFYKLKNYKNIKTDINDGTSKK